MADSLEDDFALSDVEEVGRNNSPGSDAERKDTKKRQADGGGDNEKLTEEEKRARKKRKMRQQDKNRKAKKAAALSGGGPGKVATLPPDMQADHLRKVVKSCKQYNKMTDLELDEIGIRENMLLDATAIKLQRKLENLAEFVDSALPSVVKEILKITKGESGMEGQPAVLVITGDAQRAADLAKALRKLSLTASSEGNKGNSLPVAKLFARHFKIAEQEAFLHSNICPIAVGTPKRVHDLLLKGTSSKLKLDKLKAIILDSSWTDAKMRTLLDGNETKEALCSLLACYTIQSKLKSKKKDERATIALF